MLAGTNFVDSLKIFEHDEETEGIVLIGEIGGEAELEAAEWIREYRRRSSNPKYVPPIREIPSSNLYADLLQHSSVVLFQLQVESWATQELLLYLVSQML